jgi:hypothetical protein
VGALGIQSEQLPFFVAEDLMNRLDRAGGNAGSTIDADIRIDVAPLVVGMETLDRAMLHAIGKEAESTVIRNDVGHNCAIPGLMASLSSTSRLADRLNDTE